MRKPRQAEVEQRKHSREKLLRAAGNAGSENSASMRTTLQNGMDKNRNGNTGNKLRIPAHRKNGDFLINYIFGIIKTYLYTLSLKNKFNFT